MQILGLDGMRHLGSDPRIPADVIERTVSVELAIQISREQEKANG